MALRCLWTLSRVSQWNRSIHRAAFEMQPTKVPLTDEEKRLLEKLGEPDTETKSYLNELYTDFDVVSEKRKEQKDKQPNDSRNGESSPSPSTKSTLNRISTDFARNFHTSTSFRLAEKKMIPSQSLDKEPFEDEAEIIWDHQEAIDYYPEQEKRNNLEGVVLERGEEGVFDVGELVQVLKDEKLLDIIVIELPAELPYADYFVISTMVSKRQSRAVVAFLKKMYKHKKRSDDYPLKIEGNDSDEWKLLDMGNIVLHIFNEETREKYDLESLWTVGSEFDEITAGKQKEDEVLDSLRQHMDFVRSLKPSNVNSK